MKWVAVVILMSALGAPTTTLAAPPVPSDAASAPGAAEATSVDGVDPVAEAPAPPMTAKRARQVLRRPRGSVSLGGTSHGELVDADVLPLKGPGYAVFSYVTGRGTNYGTSELVGLVKRSTAAVAKRFKGSRIGVGNLGAASGGKIRWSVSHQAGRDADLGMYALDKRGRRVELPGMVYFERGGWSRDGKYRFDAERNLAFIEAVLDDPSPVQYVFMAEWLKSIVLDEAREQGLDPERIERLAEIMHQPSDSNPHADHFHLRVYCSVQDRLEGCHNWGPERSWVDLGDAEYDARVDDLLQVAAMTDKRLRLKALKKLVTLRAPAALPAFVAALTDDRASVRAAGLQGVRVLEREEAIEGLLSALSTTESSSWAKKLFSAIGHINKPGSFAAARTAIEAPERLVHPKARRAIPALQVSATRIFARRARKEEAPLLLPLLDSTEPTVRAAAHDALLRITNQRISSRGLKSRRAKRRAPVIKRWRAFLDQHKGETWLQWLRLGFEARGYRFKPRMASRAGIEVLIKAIANRSAVVSDNAVRALSEITGHHVDPRWRNKRNNQRHWKHWWRKHADSVALR